MSEKEYKSQTQKTLPERWRMVKFGDVVRDVKIDANPENSGLERYVAGGHMQTDDLHIKQWGIIGDGYLGPAFHRKFMKGQILYGSRRTYLRKVAIAEFDGICANTTFVLESKDGELLPELLPFVMQSESFAEHSVKKSKGSVNPYVNWKDIAIYEFPLPPKDEQRRIADMLWAAEDCIVKKEKLILEIELYKKNLMEEILSKGIEHTEFKETEIGRIPKSWRVANLGKIIREDIRNGAFIQKENFGKTVPFLNVADTYKSFIVNLDNLERIKCSEKDLEVYKLQPKDLIFVRSSLKREGIGQCCIVEQLSQPAIYDCHLMRVRVNEEILMPEFLAYYSVSIKGKYALISQSKTTTMTTINQGELSSVNVPIPPLSEQRCIVTILSKFDDTIQKAHQNINKTKTLKMRLINQFLKIGLEETASSSTLQDQRIIYETQVSE